MSAAREIELIRGELEMAADAFLCCADRGLELLSEARRGSVTALDGIERAFGAIIEACAFQDLAGQRLSRLVTSTDIVAQRADDPLLAGPADPGQGVDQDAVDRLFDGA